MTKPTLVYTATCGKVSAQVIRTLGQYPNEFAIVVVGDGSAEEHVEARRQAEMFIAYEQQLARMGSCPSCGG